MQKTFYLPAKTFLLGEYLALMQGPALILTHQPCFSLTYEPAKDCRLLGVEIADPSYQFFLSKKNIWPCGHYAFVNPFPGKGGFGASSALMNFLLLIDKFVSEGRYYDACDARDRRDWLNHFLMHQGSTKGIQPSGYDGLAQWVNKPIVYHDRSMSLIEAFNWPWQEVACLLISTGKKCLTHEHLQKDLLLNKDWGALRSLLWRGKKALHRADLYEFFTLINLWREALDGFGLLSPYAKDLCHQLMSYSGVLAAKGCGAMGSDVVLALVHADQVDALQKTWEKKFFCLSVK
jgi:mevalonate kinase